MPDMGATEAIIGAQLVSGLMGADAAKDAAGTQAAAADRATGLSNAQFNRTQQNLAPWMRSGGAANVKLSELLGLESSAMPALTSMGASGTTFNPALINDPEYYNAWQEIFGGPGQGDSRGWNAADLESAIKAKLPQSYLDKYKSKSAGTAEFGKLLKPFGMEDFQESPAYQFNLEQGRKAIDKASNARGKYYAPATLQDISKFSQGLASNEFQNAYSNYNNNLNNIWNRLFAVSGAGQNAAANVGQFGANAANTASNNILAAGNAQAAGQVGGANAISGALGNAYNGYMTNQILQSLQAPAYRPQVQPSVSGQFDFGTYG